MCCECAAQGVLKLAWEQRHRPTHFRGCTYLRAGNLETGRSARIPPGPVTPVVFTTSRSTNSSTPSAKSLRGSGSAAPAFRKLADRRIVKKATQTILPAIACASRLERRCMIEPIDIASNELQHVRDVRSSARCSTDITSTGRAPRRCLGLRWATVVSKWSTVQDSDGGFGVSTCARPERLYLYLGGGLTDVGRRVRIGLSFFGCRP